ATTYATTCRSGSRHRGTSIAPAEGIRREQEVCMTRTRDMILTEPGALRRRMFRELDPWFEPRDVLPAAIRKTWGAVPWVPPLEMSERDHTLFIKLDLPGVKKEEINISSTDEGLVRKRRTACRSTWT